jgi:hypothetical protein
LPPPIGCPLNVSDVALMLREPKVVILLPLKFSSCEAGKEAQSATFALNASGVPLMVIQ